MYYSFCTNLIPSYTRIENNEVYNEEVSLAAVLNGLLEEYDSSLWFGEVLAAKGLLERSDSMNGNGYRRT